MFKTVTCSDIQGVFSMKGKIVFENGREVFDADPKQFMSNYKPGKFDGYTERLFPNEPLQSYEMFNGKERAYL